MKKQRDLCKRIIRKSKKIFNNLFNNSYLITLGKIFSICEIELPQEFQKYKNKKISNVALSCKTLIPNSVLFTDNALEYSKRELETIRNNCSFVICKKPIEGCRCIIADTPILSSIKLFQYFKSLRPVKTVSVTGSVGKTSTKEMIENVLKEEYQDGLLASQGNCNGIYYTANNILKLKKSTKVFLQEAGIGIGNGKIKIIGAMIQPDITVYTNIRDNHIEGYGTRENIFKEKVALSNSGPKDGIVFFNYDDEILSKAKYIQKSYSYSLNNPKANYYAENIQLYNDSVSFIIVDNVLNEKIDVSLDVIGEHQILNAVVAYAVGKYLNINNQTIINGLKNYKTRGNRQNLIDLGKYRVLADCYNSSYEALEFILKSMNLLETKNKGGKIAVIGDIFELGDETIRIHKKMGKLLSSNTLKHVYFYGEASKYAYDEYKKYKSNVTYCDTREKTVNVIKKNIKENDLILFKASHGMEFSSIIDEVFGTDLANSDLADLEEIVLDNNFRYRIFKAYAVVSKYLGKSEKITLPPTIDNIPVIKVGNKLFLNNEYISKAVLSDTYVRIGTQAFKNSSIKNIVLGKYLKQIGQEAFNNCELLKSVTLPDGMLLIDKMAFANCSNLEKITIPSSVRIIANDAFMNCKNLVIYAPKNAYAISYAKDNNIKYKIVDEVSK